MPPARITRTQPLKPARVALNVLALCFALSVLGRGLGESFTVFLKPISEDFGWDRAQVVSVYSLIGWRADWRRRWSAGCSTVRARARSMRSDCCCSAARS